MLGVLARGGRPNLNRPTQHRPGHPQVTEQARLTAPHETALFAMAANRLDDPVSKLACAERWNGAPDLSSREPRSFL